MKNILLLGFFFLSMSGFAQDTPQKIIDNFFSTYQKDPGRAVKEMYKTNVWTERITDDINDVANKVNGFSKDVMGQFNGYEQITTKKFSDSFVLYSYLVKYDRQPIRFTFKFYKPKDDWVLYAFQFDDSFDEEIEEAAKLYYLNLDK
ncbi:MAG: hypothetical protein K0M40_07400 [Prolixibacteraceae bacterium]|nr:hypothetical protein [Prolixibacteraceae bacterium]